MSSGRYVSKKFSNRGCEGEKFGTEGFPVQCNDTPVFELVHSNGKSLHICEYHIEFYWDAWLPFRDAVRDIWPVGQQCGHMMSDNAYGVEKFLLANFAKIKSRQDALRATFLVFKTFSIPQILTVWEKIGLFQHPRLLTETSGGHCHTTAARTPT